MKIFRFFGHQFFRKNGYVPEQNFQRENFQNRYFRFKTCFGSFEIDSNQKIFFSKFFDILVIFWAQKTNFLNFWGEKFCNFFSPISKGLYCGHFALLHAFLRLLSSAGSLDLSNFWPKQAKNRGFSNILGRNKFFF